MVFFFLSIVVIHIETGIEQRVMSMHFKSDFVLMWPSSFAMYVLKQTA